MLGAIEAMDLVDEKQGLLAGAGGVAGVGKQFLELGNPREHRRNADKSQADGLGEQAGDASLAGPRRSPENQTR